mmetsp:Transcript_18462/g.34253  ORF Transcript_18462/g.34253 Transcript_18462/m.34253 type:complete len:89 (+) Transcript_18462:263-529(+)
MKNLCRRISSPRYLFKEESAPFAMRSVHLFWPSVAVIASAGRTYSASSSKKQKMRGNAREGHFTLKPHVRLRAVWFELYDHLPRQMHR